MINRVFFYVFLGIILLSCTSPEARRPKDQSTNSFYKEVLKQNKKLNDLELKRIAYFLAKDTLTNYINSSSGFWYTYHVQDTLHNKPPVKGDVVTIRYNITDFNDSLIYGDQTIDYKVDHEDFIPALQDGIKLMKKGETITFVIPSFRAYGVTGDGNKIGINQSLKSKLTLIDIKQVNNK